MLCVRRDLSWKRRREPPLRVGRGLLGEGVRVHWQRDAGRVRALVCHLELRSSLFPGKFDSRVSKTTVT